MKYLLNLCVVSVLCLQVQPLLSQSASKVHANIPDFGKNAKAGNFARIRGFNMYYEIYGQGEPLLLIHGNTASISSLSNQIPYFAESYKVIVADSRAQGRSVDPSGT